MSKLDEQEEIDEFEAEEEQDADDDNDTDTESDAPAEAAGPAINHEESPEERTVASRQKQRQEMEDQIAAFLANGGKIAQIEPNVTVDPPRKPDSD